jgi:dTDP-glucose 4,6-dehydratase
MNKVLVIGSNSFSGSHYIDELLNRKKYEIIGVSRSPEKNEIYLPHRKNPNIKHFSFHQIDLNSDLNVLEKICDEFLPDYIVNFASQSMVGQSWDNPDHWYNTNVLALVKLIHMLKDKKYLKKYVHITTPEVYGTCEGRVTESHPFNPSTPYAASRAAGDVLIQLYVREYGFPAVFTRAANVFGPGQQLFKIIPKAICYIKLNKKIPLHGGGYARRSFIHIRDVCQATVEIMEKALPGNTYHLSTESLHQIRDVVEIIAGKMGRKFKDVVEAVEKRKGLDDAYILDSSKAKIELNWNPKISFEDALDETMGWVDDNWNVIKNEPMEYIHIN